GPGRRSDRPLQGGAGPRSAPPARAGEPAGPLRRAGPKGRSRRGAKAAIAAPGRQRRGPGGAPPPRRVAGPDGPPRGGAGPGAAGGEGGGGGVETGPQRPAEPNRLYQVFAALNAHADAVRALELRAQVELESDERDRAVATFFEISDLWQGPGRKPENAGAAL